MADNLGLTFGEIKEVLTSASEGKLEKYGSVSEKCDGMNLVFTWANGELKVARTGSDIKGGGMDAAGLAKKFFGRGNVEEAFNSAFKVLHQALGSLGEKDTTAIFAGGRRWYSMEIIYAKDPNTINYDSNNIVFHGWPIFEVQRDGSVEQSDDDSGVGLLTKRIDQMQKAVTQRDWHVRGPSLLRLKKLGDGSILQRAVTQINGAMGSGGVNDSDTVYDYLRNLFTDDAKQLGLPTKAYKMVVERCATGQPGVPEIKKETPKDKQSAMQAYVRDSDAVKAKWMAPIEGAIHSFAIEVLRGLHSTLIAKSDEEVTRVRDQLGRAIRTIEKSGHQGAMDVLQKEMSRLGNVENFAAAMEGIVFFFKGQAYKFTGSFAPAHQILSLFKYGRKGIPKMDLGEARRRLAEGGGSFNDVKPISLGDFEHIWVVLEADLEMLGCTDIETIGSTGKKPVMGDIDVAAKFEGGAPALFDAAIKVFGKDSVKRVGGNVVSVRYLTDVQPVQVDIMVGDPTYMRWGRAGASSIKGHPDYSPVKGVGRNILLNVINRWVTQSMLPGKQNETDRTRYAIDFDRGLFKVTQTKRNAKDPNKLNKDWKDVNRELVSDDPDAIVELMFGPGTKASNLKTFDGVVTALKKSPKLKKHAREILETFADEMHEMVAKNPDMLGDNGEEVLDYIANAALGEVRERQHWILFESPASDAYESDVLKSIAVAGAQGNIKSVTGSNKVLPDADIKINDIIYQVEVKMDDHAQMGGGSVGWSPDTGFFPTGTGDVEDIVTQLNHDKLLGEDISAFVELVNDELAGKETVAGFPMTIPKVTYVSLVKAGMVKPLNRTFEYDVGFIFNHYLQKGTNYMQIGGKGLFYMAANTAKLPIPQLTGRMQLEFRPGPAGSKLNAAGERRKQVSLRVQARLKVNARSPYTLDNPTSVKSLIDIVKPRELELVPHAQTVDK